MGGGSCRIIPVCLLVFYNGMCFDSIIQQEGAGGVSGVILIVVFVYWLC